MARVLKPVAYTAPIALLVWLATRFLPSRSMGEFAYRVGADFGRVAYIALVAYGVLGCAYLAIRALRR